jgi:hypothetical protein
MTHNDWSVSIERHGFATVTLRRLRGCGLKVIAHEVIGFGVAFAVSLAVSVAVVELIWRLEGGQ